MSCASRGFDLKCLVIAAVLLKLMRFTHDDRTSLLIVIRNRAVNSAIKGNVGEHWIIMEHVNKHRLLANVKIPRISKLSSGNIPRVSWQT